MKKVSLLFIFIVTAVLSINAQNTGDAFVCIGDSINVRTRAGMNYPVCQIPVNSTNGGTKKQQLSKGYGTYSTHIEYLGRNENGFLYVKCYEGTNSIGGEGWVNAQYLRPQCKQCKGYPIKSYNDGSKLICDHCKGKGYIDVPIGKTAPMENMDMDAPIPIKRRALPTRR